MASVPPAVVGAAGPQARGGRVPRLYRPQALVRLLVRIEDFSNADGLIALQEFVAPKPIASSSPSPVAASAAAAAQAQAIRRAAGEVDMAADVAAALAAGAALRTTGGDPNAGPAPPAGAAPDGLSFTLTLVAQEVSVELKGPREADKVTVLFALADLPLAPEIVRSVFVEVFAGTVPAEDYARPDRWIARLIETPPMFRGYVDDETMEAGEDDLKITFTCRSLEQRLMDAQVNPFAKERKIHGDGEPTTEYVRRLLGTVPEFNGTLGQAMGVVLFPNVDPARAPRISKAVFNRLLQSAKSQVQAGGGVQPAPAGDNPEAAPGTGTPALLPPTPAAGSAKSVWDLILIACKASGVLPVYDPSVVAVDDQGRTIPLGQNNLLLVPPQTLKQTPADGITIPGGPIDGFARDLSVGGVGQLHTEVRFFVWGSNIRTMSWSRKFGRTKAPRVRIVAHNPDAPAGRRTLVSVFPATARGTRVSAVGSGAKGTGRGHQPVDEEIVQLVRGVRSQEELDQIAVATYHSVARREVTVTITTDELCSYLDPTRGETHNENPDLLRLRPGTPCVVTVGRKVEDPAQGLVINGLSELFERRFNAAFLRRALLDQPGGGQFLSPTGRARVEDAIAKIGVAYAKAALTDWFYVRTVRHAFRPDADNGYELEVELCNYVEARSDPRRLGKQDRERNDKRKAVKPGQAPDGRKRALVAGLDEVLGQLGRRP